MFNRVSLRSSVNRNRRLTNTSTEATPASAMDAGAAVEAPVPNIPPVQPVNNTPEVGLGLDEAGSAPVRRRACRRRTNSTPAEAEAAPPGPAPPGPAVQQAEWPVGAEHQGRRADPANFKPGGPCCICGDTCEFLSLYVAAGQLILLNLFVYQWQSLTSYLVSALPNQGTTACVV